MPRWGIALITVGPLLLIGIATAIILHSAERPSAESLPAPNQQVARSPEQALAPKAMPPPIPPLAEDKTATELTRLRAENERLRTSQATAPLTPALAPAASRPTLLAGAAWIQRENGDTSLLRGLKIALLRPRVSSRPVKDVLIAAIPEWENLIGEYRQMVKDSQVLIQQYGDPGGSLAKSQADEVQTALGYQVKVDTYKRLIASLPEEIGTSDAYGMTKDCDAHGRGSFDSIATTAAISQTEADVDGKYGLEIQNNGDYFVFSKVDTSLLFVEWLIPIRADGKPMKVDFYNSNATTTKNFSP